MFDPWGDQLVNTGGQQSSSFQWDDFSVSPLDSSSEERRPGASKSEQNQFAMESFQALPDSSQYLSVLEGKLSRLQGKTKSKTTAAGQSRDLLTGLAALRSDRMKAFLDMSTTGPTDAKPTSTDATTNTTTQSLSSNFIESDPLYSSWVMQRLFPERQALTEEELAVLVRNDVLAGLNGQTETEEQPQSTYCAPGLEDAANQSSLLASDQHPLPGHSGMERVADDEIKEHKD